MPQVGEGDDSIDEQDNGEMGESPMKEVTNSSSDEFILGSMVESGFNAGAIKNLFERGLEKNFKDNLDLYVEKQARNIEGLCSTHYEEFLKAVSKLQQTKEDTVSLKESIVNLDRELQQIGCRALAQGKVFLKHRVMEKNISKVIDIVKHSRYVSAMRVKANKQMNEKKFYHALVTLNQLERAIQRIRHYRFAKIIQESIPESKIYIQNFVKGEFNDWLVIAKDQSMSIGEYLIKQTQTEQRNNNLTSYQHYATENTFEMVNMDFRALYRFKHIYETMGKHDELRKDYNKNRSAQLEHLMKISLEDHDFALNSAWVKKILGFFVIEHHVMLTTNKFFSEVELKKRWENCRLTIVQKLDQYFENTEEPAHFLEMKDVLTMFSLTLNKRLHLDVEELAELIQKHTLRFGEIVGGNSRKEIQKVISQEDYQPMKVNNAEEYTRLGEYNLIPTKDLESRIGSIRFPITVDFSKTIPRICNVCTEFLNQFFQYSQYLSDLDEVIKTGLQGLLKVVEREFDNLIDSTATGALGQLSHITLNARAMGLACNFIEQKYWELKKKYKPLTPIHHKDEIVVLKQASKNFQKKADMAQEKLQSNMLQKITSILSLLSGIEWISTAKSAATHDFAQNLTIYIKSTMQVIKAIPNEKKALIIFKCAHVINEKFVSELKEQKYINKVTIESLKEDIEVISKSFKTFNPTVDNCFQETLKSLKIVLSAKEIPETHEDPLAEIIFTKLKNYNTFLETAKHQKNDNAGVKKKKGLFNFL